MWFGVDSVKVALPCPTHQRVPRKVLTGQAAHRWAALRKGNTMSEDIKGKVLTTIEAIKSYGEKGEMEVANALISHGMSELEAEIFVAFVPLAFGRVFLLERLREKIRISTSENISIFHEKSNSYLSLPLQDEPVYVEAYKIAKEISSTGRISAEQLQSIIFYGAEADTINNALRSGATLESLNGAKINPPVLMNLGQIEGFESRYPQISQQKPWWKFGS